MRACMKAMLFVLTVLIPTVAHAGPGAIIYGCTYFGAAPPSPLTVNFMVGFSSVHCMNSTGSDASMTVSSAGITCVSVGYVESKSSTTIFQDTCGSDDSVWTLAYSVPNTAFSGSATTDWPKKILGVGSNSLELEDQFPGTMVCGGDSNGNTSLCNATSITWDSGSQGPVYIIFQPQSGE